MMKMRNMNLAVEYYGQPVPVPTVVTVSKLDGRTVIEQDGALFVKNRNAVLDLEQPGDLVACFAGFDALDGALYPEPVGFKDIPQMVRFQVFLQQLGEQLIGYICIVERNGQFTGIPQGVDPDDQIPLLKRK